MASSMALKIACMVVACMVVAAPFAEAITCSSVVTSLAPCITYLRNGGPVSGTCCSGVKSLLAQAKTTVDRRTACGCLKTASTTIKINPANAASLPKKCGVNIPYPISPNVDCSKVQ